MGNAFCQGMLVFVRNMNLGVLIELNNDCAGLSKIIFVPSPLKVSGGTPGYTFTINEQLAAMTLKKMIVQIYSKVLLL